jgi:hypothetical protein
MTGYSSTPLWKKLGLKTGHSIFISKAPAAYFEWITPLPDEISAKTKLSGQLDFIHLFVSDQKEFKTTFLKAKAHLKPDAMLWISWPKKTSKVPTDLDENIIREFGLQNGLVDVKVCSVSEVWSGLKFVFRLKDR